MSLEIKWKEEEIKKKEELFDYKENNNSLKNSIIEHTKKKLERENIGVTIEEVIEVLVSSFPDIILAIAEENWIRGYKQATEDNLQMEE